MLIWALFASDQLNMRKLGGQQTLATTPSISQWPRCLKRYFHVTRRLPHHEFSSDGAPGDERINSDRRLLYSRQMPKASPSETNIVKKRVSATIHERYSYR